MDTPAPTRPHRRTAVRYWAAVHTPSSWRGPVCARHGCYHHAWFAIHHVPVCSSRCAERIAEEVPQEPSTFVPVVRAVRWTHEGAPWTLVIASGGRRHQLLRAWWWRGRGHHVGTLTRSRTVDVLTNDGLFAFLRRLVRAGVTDLRPYRLTHSTPPWADLTGTDAPDALARRTMQRARTAVRRAEQVAALRARYRQRGVSHDGTTAHASRVA